MRHNPCFTNQALFSAPPRGKETYMFRLFVIIVLGCIGTAALTSCRMEGQIGDTAHIAAPR